MNKKETNAKCSEKTARDKIIKKLYLRGAQYDADGRAVINMTVKDYSDFLSPYSERSTAVISSGVAEFIENSTYATPPAEPLTLRIYSDSITDGEKEEYRAAIREYYAQKYTVTKKTYRFNVITLI